MTYATMFPQNVGHIAISGIMDAADYYSTQWSKFTMYVYFALNPVPSVVSYLLQ